MHQEELIYRFSFRQAAVAVIGMGYVGLPLTRSLLETGFRVIGLDVDPNKVQSLNAEQSYIKHIDVRILQESLADGTFIADTEMSRVAEADAIILCLPTPLDRYRQPDLSYVTDTIDTLLPHLRQGQMLSLESTTYPGTTEEELLPRVESAGLRIGEDFFLVYSPEREDPANPNFTTRDIPKVCGGVTEECRRVGEALYSQIVDRVVPVSTTRAAEMTKLLENIHRAVNIGLVNEMKIVADRMGIDIYEVINAAATKPFGFVPYYPGPGLGGHCLPIDPFYLTWKAREYTLNTRFIELAGEVNSSMPEWVVAKLADALNDQGKPIRGSRILVLGIAYKKNVDDTRESPAIAMMDLLRSKGAELAYSDPHVPVFPKLRKYSFDLESTSITPDTLCATDCVLLATDHDAFDYELIYQYSPVIVDTRGVFRENYYKVVKA